MGKKISIIVPIYNTGKYLKRCLNSIIEQEYKNIEIILVNDGSNDNSLSICNSYKNKDDRIIVIDKKHTGVADSRNVGIKRATGEYIGFVDSDDYIDKDMYKKLIFISEKCNAEIAMCDLVQTFKQYDKKRKGKEYFMRLNKEQALRLLLYDKYIGNYLWVKIFKKELFDDIKFPTGQIYEDISTTYKLFRKANNLVYLPIKMYHYYQREESICNNKTRKTIKQYLTAIFERYYDLKCTLKSENLQLYNVYSIVNSVIKMSIWAIEIQDYELFYNEILNYFYQIEEEIKLVDELELIKIMSDAEKVCFYLQRIDIESLKKFIERNFYLLE